MCEEAKKNLSNGDVILASMENLPFKNSVMDKAMAVYSMVYSSHKQKVMKEVFRVLGKSGEFVIYDPNKVSLRTLFRYLLCVKFSMLGEKNLKALHHEIVTNQSLNYFQFKKLGSEFGLKVSRWYDHFSYYIALSAINKSVLTDIALFMLKVVGYKRWGTLLIIKFFSDLLTIKFVKKER